MEFKKKQKFSIRKLTLGTTSVLLGTMMFLGNAEALANEQVNNFDSSATQDVKVKYLAVNEQELTAIEKQLIIREDINKEIATSNDTYILIYKPKEVLKTVLPNTGVSKNIFNLLAAGVLLVIVYKLGKRKSTILGVALLTAISGITNSVSAKDNALLLTTEIKNHLKNSNLEKLEISGYDYVGYILDENVPNNTELYTLLADIKNNCPQIYQTKEVSVKEDNTLGTEIVKPKIDLDISANKELQFEKQPIEETVVEREEVTIEERELPYKEVVKQDETIWADETVEEQVGEVGKEKITTTTKYVKDVAQPNSKIETEIIKQPVDRVIKQGTKPLEREDVEIEERELPYKEVVKKDETIWADETVEEQVGKVGKEKITTTTKYVKDVAQLNPKIETEIVNQPVDRVIKQGIKPLEREDVEIEERELPYKEVVKQDETIWADETVEEQVGEVGKEKITTTTKYVKDVAQPNPKIETEIVNQPVDRVIKQGTKPLEREEVTESERDILFETETVKDINLWIGETEEVAGELGKEKVTTTTKYVKDAAQPNPKVETEVIKRPVNKIIKEGIKERIVPTLEIVTFNDKNAEELTSLNDKKLDKTVEVGFNLAKDQNVVSKKYVLKKNGVVVREADLLEKLSLSDLEHDVEYTLDLNVGYNIGKGIENLTASKKFILELKKIEIKDVREYKFYKVDEGNNVRINSLTTIPNDTDKYYVEVLSDKNKTLVLPVDKVEEINGEFKITLKAEDLVEKREATYEKNHDFLFPKTKIVTAAVDAIGVRTFSELISKLQENKDNAEAKIELLADVSATEIDKNNDLRYVPGIFKAQFNGNGFIISDTTKPLFDTLNNAKINNVKIKDASIQLVEENSGILSSKIENNSTITNLEVAGKVGGLTHVGGVTGVLDNSSITNLKVDAEVFRTQNIPNYYRKPHNGKHIGGVAGFANNNVNLEKAHIKVAIKPNYASGNGTTGGVFARVTGRVSSGKLDKVYVEGTIDPVDVQGNSGGIIGNGHNSFLPISNVITAVDVKRGNLVRHTHGSFKDGIFVVEDKAKGADTNVNNTKIQSSEVDAKLAEWGIEKIENKYEYREEKHADLLHTNTEKFIPLYNTSQIEKNAAKLGSANSKFTTSKILSVLPTKAGKLVTKYTDTAAIDGVLVHFEDGTMSRYNAKFKEKFNNLLNEYEIAELGIIYTPESFVNHTTLVGEVSDILNSVNVDSYKHIDLEEHVQIIKSNIAEEVAKLLSAENVFEGSSETVKNAIKNKITQNKDEIMLGLNYLTRWYNIDIKDTNIRDLITYNTRFFGMNVSPLDTMIHLGRSTKKSTTSWNIYQGPWIDDVGLNELKMMYNPAVFKTALADSIGVSNILDFYKMLNDKFGKYASMEEWFKATTKAYISESSIGPNQELSSVNKTYERLSRSGSELNPYILPLLTAREGIYMIVNPAAISVGMSEKYVDTNLKETNPEEFNKKVAEHKAQLDRQAKHYETHYTFWYNMMDSEFRPKLERDILSVDNYNVKGKWRGMDNKTNSMLDFFMPMGIWINSHPSSAYADGSRVHFSTVDQLGDYGSAIYAHEMVHNNDGYAYFNGKGRRNNIGAEYFATGIFQPYNPGELDWKNFTLNTMYDNTNSPNKDSDTRTVVLSPNRIDTPDELQDYVKKSLDIIYTLEHAEADVLVQKDNADKKQWYNWVETVDSTDIKAKYSNLHKGNNNSINVRHALDDDRASRLNSINDLVDNEIIFSTYGTGYNDIFGLQGGNTYYYAKLFEPMYATGENTKGSAGDLMFRRMAFEMLAYKGYKNGLMPYLSNVLNATKPKEDRVVTDTFVIKTVSENNYSSMKDFKKAMYAERKANASNLKQVTINYGGQVRTITTYDDIMQLIREAVEADLVAKNKNKSIEVKNKIYTAYLKLTNDFVDDVYK